MLAKHWRPGAVKTRLAATIGDTAAAELHRVFVRELATRLAACGDRRWILASPDPCCEAFAAEVDPAWRVVPQGDGDLGQRMWRGFRSAATGAASAATPAVMPAAASLMIGADLPTLTAAELEQAFAALESHDVVLGPARDGGYYLIGLRGNMLGADAHRWQALFSGVAWSTPTVLTQTLQLARQSKLKVAMLQQRADIDTGSELASLIQQLRRPSSAADATLAEQIDQVLRRCRVTCSFPAQTRTN